MVKHPIPGGAARPSSLFRAGSRAALRAGTRVVRSAAASAAFLCLAFSACVERDLPTGPAPDAAGTSRADGRSHGDHAHGLAVAPSGFAEATVVSGLAGPTAMAVAPDGRIFVCEKAGRLRVVKDGVLLAEPFLTVGVNAEGERGLLGVAFDPDFADNRWVYVYYTASGTPRHNRIVRFAASASDPDVADPASATLVMALDPLSTATNHNGGAIHFGPDGKLYAAVGDNATPSHAQSLSNTFGKLLRIDKDGTIPSDNPYYANATGNARAIWALGLRNPYNFAFQPGTGRLFVNDVGWQSWEEINEGARGANYGWPSTEGPTTASGVRAPILAYANTRNTRVTGEGCAVTGAAFYNPASVRFPSDYVGDYFFGDYCSGWIRKLDIASGAVSTFVTGVSGLTDIQVGDDGALYYLAYTSGLLRRVDYTGSQAPVVTQHPQGATVSAGGSATFSVAASGADPLAYRWQRDGADIAGATAASYTVAQAQAADSGARFRCVVTNAHGSATSSEAILSVTSNRPPVATITSPATGAAYRGGQVLSWSGTGTDPEDGELPASAFTWQVDFHHDTHTHPLLEPTSGATSGSLAIPTEGETSSNVWIRVYLTVRDAAGLAHRVHVDVQPVTARITLATSPSGLQIRLDGTAFPSPHAFTGVAGIRRQIAAPSPQTVGGKSYEFVAWSDGGAADRFITTPSEAATYTATFREISAAPTAAYEAEAATMEGAEPRSLYPGYSGTAYVKYQNYRSWVEWSIDVPGGGPRTLEFRYALGTADPRTIRVYLNGATVAQPAFPSTGSWSSWGTVTVSTPMNAGRNTVRAMIIGDGGFFMDHMVVR